MDIKNGEDLVELSSIPIEEIRDAECTIKDNVLRTPLVKFNSKGLQLPEIYLKLENLQHTGAFKIRGATNVLKSSDHSDHLKLHGGVYTTSTGNFAQGLAYVAQSQNIPCTVVCPESAPGTKVKVVEQLGAKVLKISKEKFWEALFSKHYDLPGQYIHPCCNRLVIAGNGTIGLEILDDLEAFDAVVIPFGGGGLSTGIASAIKHARPEVKVYVCEVDIAAPLTASIEAGEPAHLTNHKTSFVDGMAGTTVFPEMWKLVRNLIDDVFVVSEKEIGKALKILLQHNKVLVEGSAAATLAAVLRHQETFSKHKRIVCVMSGGNLDTSVLVDILLDKIK